MKNKNDEKLNQIKLTSEQYLKAIRLGYYENLECLSVFLKKVKHYKVCGRTEILIVEIVN
jgi:hypothetical protein